MKHLLKLLVSTACFALCVTGAEDSKLASLEVALDEAMTQTAMNMASFEISEYLKEELQSAEQQVRAHLFDDQSRTLFDSAASAWIDYRTAQVKFEGNSYAGGSIQPLIINLVSARITRERLNLLNEHARLSGP